jgi:autotransporter-associated beta strand protein
MNRPAARRRQWRQQPDGFLPFRHHGRPGCGHHHPQSGAGLHLGAGHQFRRGRRPHGRAGRAGRGDRLRRYHHRYHDHRCRQLPPGLRSGRDRLAAAAATRRFHPRPPSRLRLQQRPRRRRLGLVDPHGRPGYGFTTINGAIGGVGANQDNVGLIKSGLGTLTLSGSTLSYVGQTTVLGGRLNITGGQSAALRTSSVKVHRGLDPQPQQHRRPDDRPRFRRARPRRRRFRFGLPRLRRRLPDGL